MWSEFIPTSLVYFSEPQSQKERRERVDDYDLILVDRDLEMHEGRASDLTNHTPLFFQHHALSSLRGVGHRLIQNSPRLLHESECKLASDLLLTEAESDLPTSELFSLFSTKV